MDLVVALAQETGADIAIANDPDADRCAVAVPDCSGGGGWRMLRGDEVGILLADHLMRRGRTGRYATTIVSSSLLGAVCAKRGHPYAETLTGFKWIMRAGDDDTPLAFGYEEALGYCVAPGHVRDKDGITAALLIAELAAGLKAESRTLTDRLDEIAAEFGVYATDQAPSGSTTSAEIAELMRRIPRTRRSNCSMRTSREIVDLLPDNDVLILPDRRPAWSSGPVARSRNSRRTCRSSNRSRTVTWRRRGIAPRLPSPCFARRPPPLSAADPRHASRRHDLASATGDFAAPRPGRPRGPRRVAVLRSAPTSPALRPGGTRRRHMAHGRRQAGRAMDADRRTRRVR